MMFDLRKLFGGGKGSSEVADAIEYEGYYFPNKRSNEALNNDQSYAESAIELVETLTTYVSVTPKTRILDFGSGQGRLANGLLMAKSPFLTYLGIDTQEESVAWCKKWISSKHKNIEFLHLPAKNERYNPNAHSLQKLPDSIGKFELAFLNSVFSHMLTNDVCFYLKEIKRKLHNGGTIYMTAHIDENVPNVEENPSDYLGRRSVGALHRVRYEKEFFLAMVAEAGYKNIVFLHRAFDRTGQSIVVANT